MSFILWKFQNNNLSFETLILSLSLNLGKVGDEGL